MSVVNISHSVSCGRWLNLVGSRVLNPKQMFVRYVSLKRQGKSSDPGTAEDIFNVCNLRDSR